MRVSRLEMHKILLLLMKFLVKIKGQCFEGIVP